MSDRLPNFALSLSGGGLSSLAYAGFVDVLREHKLQPTTYAGLSGGAMLSVLLASNMSTQDILAFMLHLKSFKLLNFRLKHLEVVNHTKLISLIRSMLPYKTFEQLPTPVVLFATDVTKKQPITLYEGDIASAIVGSCSIFPMLQPVKRRGILLSDGGFTVYYGAKYLRDMGVDKIIGVDVTGISEGKVRGILSSLYKQINSSIGSVTRYELAESPVDLDIKISFPSPTIFSIHNKAHHLIKLGRRIAEDHIPSIKRIVL